MGRSVNSNKVTKENCSSSSSGLMIPRFQNGFWDLTNVSGIQLLRSSAGSLLFIIEIPVDRRKPVSFLTSRTGFPGNVKIILFFFLHVEIPVISGLTVVSCQAEFFVKICCLGFRC